MIKQDLENSKELHMPRTSLEMEGTFNIALSIWGD
jgi:hypothetical protein